MQRNLFIAAALAVFIAPAAGAQPLNKKSIAQCASKKSDAERLICYDGIASRIGVDGPQVKIQGGGAGIWKIKTSTSPVDDSQTVTLYVDANHPVAGRYETVTPTLIIRCLNNNTSVFVHWDVYLGLDSTRVLTRIDKEKARTQSWEISTNNSATFYPAADIDFIKRLFGHEKLLAQVTPYSANSVMATFNVSGLEQAITPLRNACHW